MAAAKNGSLSAPRETIRVYDLGSLMVLDIWE
jgi:hypothetical protein